MDEKIVELNESDLDNVVGGAFNQKAVTEMGLMVKTNKSGVQAFLGNLDASSGNPSNGNSILMHGGPLSEKILRNALRHEKLSISVRTTSGEMKTLSRSDLQRLLS